MVRNNQQIGLRKRRFIGINGKMRHITADMMFTRGYVCLTTVGVASRIWLSLPRVTLRSPTVMQVSPTSWVSPYDIRNGRRKKIHAKAYTFLTTKNQIMKIP